MARLTLLLRAAIAATAKGYSVIPQRSSGFVGRDVYHATPSSRNNGVNGARATLEMKKGKANVPPQMRQQYKRAQEMENYRQQMMDSQVRLIFVQVARFLLKGLERGGRERECVCVHNGDGLVIAVSTGCANFAG